MGRSILGFRGLITASLALIIIGSVRSNGDDSGVRLTDDLALKIDHAANSRPPNLYAVSELAVDNAAQAAEIAARYARESSARGEEAGLIAATIVEAIDASANDACLISTAVIEQTEATEKEERIICSRVAKAAFAGSATQDSADFVTCLAEKLDKTIDEATKLASISRVTTLPSASSPAIIGQDLRPGSLIPRHIGATEPTSATVETTDPTGSNVQSDAEEFDSGRKKRNRRTSRSQ